MNYAVQGSCARDVITEGDARLLVWMARRYRLARVHRKGRRGARGWVLSPRNPDEHLKRKGLLR